MKRFYCKPQDIKEGRIYITDKQEAHHIKDVLRMKINDKIVVFSGTGAEYEGLISELKPEHICIKIQRIKPALSKNAMLDVTIACAIPKKAKMDDIIDKLIQLGVNRIIPLLTEHTVVRWNGEQRQKHHQRWQKIALSACKQSQRSDLPVIEPVKEIKEVLLEARDFDLKLIPTLAGERKALHEALKCGRYQRILFFIGPEGDFSLNEINLARQAGFIPVSLGQSVLRVDTAAIAVASFIRLYEPRLS